MLKNKSLMALFLAVAMVIVPVFSAAAAPLADTITGIVQSCNTSTDAYTGTTIVVCTITLADGSTQTVSLSAADAQTLGLATINSVCQAICARPFFRISKAAITAISHYPAVLPLGIGAN